jgi:hypothetical protein
MNKYIKEGDTVLISGLYGDDVSFANNKLGYVKQVFTMSNPVSFNFGAQVQLNEKHLIPINFLYLYKINTLEGIDPILLDKTFITRYLKSKKMVTYVFISDIDEIRHLLIFSENNTKHFLTISTLN